MPLDSSAERIFSNARQVSEEGIKDLRSKATEMLGEHDDILVGLNGSFARREATSSSDIDLFFLYTGKNELVAKDLQSKFLKSSGYPAPAAGGVFSEPLSVNSICDTIGGQDDDNMQTTRRMLLLLEGEWIFNEELFTDTRRKLLEKYVSTDLQKKQICLYLLNDVIRYWRTICVDFEFKIHTSEESNKFYRLRLIKLRFSRKLLFFAGVLAIVAIAMMME